MQTNQCNKWLNMGVTQFIPDRGSGVLSKQAVAARKQSPRIPYSVDWMDVARQISKHFRGGKEQFSSTCLSAVFGKSRHCWSDRLSAMKDRMPGILICAGARSLPGGGRTNYYTLCDDWEIKLQIILDDNVSAHRARQSIAKRKI